MCLRWFANNLPHLSRPIQNNWFVNRSLEHLHEKYKGVDGNTVIRGKSSYSTFCSWVCANLHIKETHKPRPIVFRLYNCPWVNALLYTDYSGDLKSLYLFVTHQFNEHFIHILWSLKESNSRRNPCIKANRYPVKGGGAGACLWEPTRCAGWAALLEDSVYAMLRRRSFDILWAWLNVNVVSRLGHLWLIGIYQHTHVIKKKILNFCKSCGNFCSCSVTKTLAHSFTKILINEWDSFTHKSSAPVVHFRLIIKYFNIIYIYIYIKGLTA